MLEDLYEIESLARFIFCLPVGNGHMLDTSIEHDKWLNYSLQHNLLAVFFLLQITDLHCIIFLINLK